ncbi:hypothetical protein ISCGN_011341 [Ixodes scapularis]
MCSVGAAKTAVSGRGTSVSGNPEEYKIILPTLPTGYVATNSVILYCDVKGRPYRIQDFRDELRRLEVLKDLASAGPHQMNHVWMLRLHTLQAKQRLVDAKELTVKGGRCLVLDPANAAVKLKLHWVPYDVPNCQVKKEMERYGKVSDITRDFFREKGFEAVESNTRSVRLTLKEGYTTDSLPHEIRLEGCKVLVVVPGRAPLCLRCRRKGHIRRDCRVPRCTDCHRYGHETDDCVKTYASIARDRKSEDNSDYVMDDAEAEEAVGGSPPAALTRTEPSGVSKPNDDGDPDAATPSQDSEATVQVQVLTGEGTKEQLDGQKAYRERAATTVGHPEHDDSNGGADDSKDVDMDSSLTGKRPAVAPEPASGTATHGTAPKKSRAVKPRFSTEDRRKEDSL